MKTELLHRCQGPSPAAVSSLVGGSVSESSQASRLVDSVGLPVNFRGEEVLGRGKGLWEGEQHSGFS